MKQRKDFFFQRVRRCISKQNQHHQALGDCHFWQQRPSSPCLGLPVCQRCHLPSFIIQPPPPARPALFADVVVQLGRSAFLKFVTTPLLRDISRM